jgi:hypothetical protein
LMPFLIPCRASNSGADQRGAAERLLDDVEDLLVLGGQRSEARWSASPPMVGA